jgi:hypothetical protein
MSTSAPATLSVQAYRLSIKIVAVHQLLAAIRLHTDSKCHKSITPLNYYQNCAAKVLSGSLILPLLVQLPLYGAAIASCEQAL